MAECRRESGARGGVRADVAGSPRAPEPLRRTRTPARRPGRACGTGAPHPAGAEGGVPDDRPGAGPAGCAPGDQAMSPGSRPAHPPHGARRLPWRRAELVSLDFEATGLDFDKDTVISFGTVPIRDGRIDIGSADYELVDPGEDAPSPVSIPVHGLRPADLRGAQGLDAARTSLGRQIEGRFLVTWAGMVEAGFLNRIYGGGVRSWMRRCIDARELMFALEEHPEPPFTLSSVAEGLGVPVASAHHALDDALVTAQVFQIAASRLEATGVRTVRELQRTHRPEAPVLRRPRAAFG